MATLVYMTKYIDSKPKINYYKKARVTYERPKTKSLSVPLLSSYFCEEWRQTARLMGWNLERKTMLKRKTIFGKLAWFILLTIQVLHVGENLCVTPTWCQDLAPGKRVTWPRAPLCAKVKFPRYCRNDVVYPTYPKMIHTRQMFNPPLPSFQVRDLGGNPDSGEHKITIK